MSNNFVNVAAWLSRPCHQVERLQRHMSNTATTISVIVVVPMAPDDACCCW
jgi:hypothetical protein